jgi:hypothetical protein
MLSDDVNGQLWDAVEAHPTVLSDDGESRVRKLVSVGAKQLADEPERSAEAVANLQRILDLSAEKSAASAAGGGALAAGAAITEASVEAALRDLCPIFPFCK